MGMRKKLILPFIREYYEPDHHKPATWRCRFCGVTYSGGHVMRMLGHLLPTEHPLGKKKPCAKVDAHIPQMVAQRCMDSSLMLYKKQGRASPLSPAARDLGDLFEAMDSSKTEARPADSPRTSAYSYSVWMPNARSPPPRPKPEPTPTTSTHAETGPSPQKTASNLDKAISYLKRGMAVAEIPADLLASDYFQLFLQHAGGPARWWLEPAPSLQTVHEQLRADTRRLIRSTKYVHLSVDAWTAAAGHHFLALVVHAPAPFALRVRGAAQPPPQKAVLQLVRDAVHELGPQRVVSFLHDHSLLDADLLLQDFPWLLTQPLSLGSLEKQEICQNLQSCFQSADDLATAAVLVAVLQPALEQAPLTQREKTACLQFVRHKLGLHPQLDEHQLVQHLYDWLAADGLYSRNHVDYAEAWNADMLARPDFNTRSWWQVHFPDSPLTAVYLMLRELPAQPAQQWRCWAMDNMPAGPADTLATLEQRMFVKYNDLALHFHRHPPRAPESAEPVSDLLDAAAIGAWGEGLDQDRLANNP